MSEPFVGEMRMFAGNFAPRSWAFCDGQLLAVSQNDALFSLLGTIYGGDGRTTFGLPDLRGRLPMHAGAGPGLSSRRLGAKSGSEKVTVTVNDLASHGHALQGSTANGSDTNPSGNVLAGSTVIEPYYNGSPTTEMAGASVSTAGGSQSHTNLMPFLCIHFIIALFGIYPSRQ
ncbi:Microcystin dependent protein [hydrothermal vent metagenome]|uniref:Microcystin dependent protein n=1 Tax=hydrothermal vent metagenome TaxID=652676 RepID=A0A3B1C8F0_9ZZZZ